MKKDRYIYPALFDYADDGITVTFPDLPGCITCGDNDEEAFAMTKEALALHLFGMEENGDTFMKASAAKHVYASANQTVVLIETMTF